MHGHVRAKTRLPFCRTASGLFFYTRLECAFLTNAGHECLLCPEGRRKDDSSVILVRGGRVKAFRSTNEPLPGDRTPPRISGDFSVRKERRRLRPRSRARCTTTSERQFYVSPRPSFLDAMAAPVKDPPSSWPRAAPEADYTQTQLKRWHSCWQSAALVFAGLQASRLHAAY